MSVTGADAREFLHAQLTNDIEHLAPGRAALAGWCSAKGRLLATFLVVPVQDGFLLQLAKDLVPSVLRRLSMFVLRSKVKIEDASSRQQFGVWGGAQGEAFSVAGTSIQFENRRTLVISDKTPEGAQVDESRWTLEEIHAGRPLITAATQDMFVPQMVNYEKLGAVDFGKGCYPGQEVVARAQYRGEVKRRMVRLPAPAGAALAPGQEFNGGVVVDSAGGELLAVMPV